MIRRFHTLMTNDERALERWLNERAELTEGGRGGRGIPHRHLMLESTSMGFVDGVTVILAVISRLEDDDEG